MIEVATGLFDVDQKVDGKGPLDSEKHANLTVHNRPIMVTLWPFEWLWGFISTSIGSWDMRLYS